MGRPNRLKFTALDPDLDHTQEMSLDSDNMKSNKVDFLF